MQRRIVDRGKRNLRSQIEELEATLRHVVSERTAERAQPRQADTLKLGDDVDSLRRAAYIARQFFDYQLLFVTLCEPPS